MTEDFRAAHVLQFLLVATEDLGRPTGERRVDKDPKMRQPSFIDEMGEIEKQAAAFEKVDVTVLPIVMNTREQITADMTANGVTTPFLLDDGTVSEAYGTLGKGMHAGLPGHSFVLIDRQGRQRWYGEYPSMWLAPQDLLDEIRSNLSA